MSRIGLLENKDNQFPIPDVGDSKEFVVILKFYCDGEEHFDILTDWHLKRNQTTEELRKYALEHFCLSYNSALDFKSKESKNLENFDNYVDDISDIISMDIIHIDDLLKIL